MPAQKSVLTVLAIEIRCAISTLGLITRRKLVQATDLVNSHIEFTDGSVSRIYRETTMRDLETTPQVMLGVRFQSSAHWIEPSRPCPLPIRVPFNTLLFAAHRGFHSKLWLTDPTTDYYEGSTSGRTKNRRLNTPRLSGSCSLLGWRLEPLPTGS